MEVEDLLAEGVGVFRKNPQLILPPLLKYLVYFILLAVWAVLIGGSLLLAGWGMLFFVAAAAISMIIFLKVMIAGSFFTAGLVGVAAQAYEGNAAETVAFVASARRKWMRLLQVEMIYLTFLLALCLLLLPPLAAYVLGHWALALSAALVASSLILAVTMAAGILLMPLKVIVVLDDIEPLECFGASAGYVRGHLVETLLIYTTSTLISTLLYAAASVLTGPVQIAPIIGMILWIALTFVSMAFNMAYMEAQMTLWFVGLMRQRQAL